MGFFVIRLYQFIVLLWVFEKSHERVLLRAADNEIA
jgi:hypothetical protein